MTLRQRGDGRGHAAPSFVSGWVGARRARCPSRPRTTALRAWSASHRPNHRPTCRPRYFPLSLGSPNPHHASGGTGVVWLEAVWLRVRDAQPYVLDMAPVFFLFFQSEFFFFGRKGLSWYGSGPQEGKPEGDHTIGRPPEGRWGFGKPRKRAQHGGPQVGQDVGRYAGAHVRAEALCAGVDIVCDVCNHS